MGKQVDILQIKLEVDGEGKIKASLAGVGKGVDGVHKKQKKAAGSAGLLKRALAAIGGGLVIRSIIKTNVQFERLNITLKSITGSAETGKATMAALTNAASGSGNSVESLTMSFIRLKSFGLDPLDGTMQSIIDQNAALGGAQDTLRGLILGVGQAWAKQKLQGEEILQLLERGVPVWDILAKRLNKTARELQYMSERGELGRTEIKLLIDEMGRMNAGAAAAQADTLGGALIEMKDAAKGATFALSGESGLITTMKNAARSAANFFRNISGTRTIPQVTQEIEFLAGSLAKMAKLSPHLRLINNAQIQRDTAALAELRLELAKLEQTAAAAASKKTAGAVGLNELTAKEITEQKKRHDAAIKYVQSKVDRINEIEAMHLTNLEILYYNDAISWEEKERLKTEVQARADQERLEASRQTADEWARMWQGTIDRFAGGMGDAVADIILEHKSLEDAMRQVLLATARQVISTLVEISIKKLFLSQQESAQRAAMTAELVAEGQAIAVGMASAAAMTSLATAGSNSIPAQAGIASTVALAETLAVSGVAHEGMDEVRTDGSYYLKGGELVADPVAGKGLRGMIKDYEQGGGSGGGDGVVVHQHFPNVMDTEGFSRLLYQHRGQVVGMLQEHLERRGRAA